jgi:3-phenylpropionate/trans-cinnamate dioxygenase ferredoxin component
MENYTEIGKINDIAEGAMKRITIDDKEILMARVDGKYYAAAGRCPHMKGLLAKGKLKETVVTCSVHGSQFDLRNGKVVRWVEGSGFMSLMGRLMSAIGMAAKKEKPLAIYEVKVDEDRVLVKLPE